MKSLQCLLLSVAVLGLASCSGNKTAPAPATTGPQITPTKPQELIIGKWQRADPGKEKDSLEFAAEGKIKSGDYAGTYKFLDDQTIEYEIVPIIGVQYSKCKVKVTKDELICDVVEAKHKAAEGEPYAVDENDRQRKGVEKYKRAQ
ncbi:MAG: hypothetical protein K2R98_33925 [Gemmataceae bacterium]|nr:hypothetical protein [Gemmataceae bacterium]